MDNLQNKVSTFMKDYDPSNKYIRKPKKSLDEFIEEINNKKSWNLHNAKRTLDYLYELKKDFYLNKNEDKIKKIDFYIDYLNHQISVLNNFQSHLLTLVATIFLPLSFITGFFGMNFKSMGVPSLKHGIFNIKNADKKILYLSLILIILIIYLFYGFLKVS